MTATTSPRPLLIGLAGQPNVGKSTLFNLLTGLDQRVGNWPGKTVARREGHWEYQGARVTLVDLPGTYSLTADSPEEKIARDFILHEQPDVVIMVADAAALERNLYLLAELLLLPVPVVLGLNRMDLAHRQGLEIEPHVLAAALGLPVIPLVARQAQGVVELMAAALDLARTPQNFRPARPRIAAPHRQVLTALRDQLAAKVPLPYPPHWAATKLLEGDREVIGLARGWLGAEGWPAVAALLSAHEDAVVDIATGRYAWIGRMIRAGVKRPRLGQVGLTDQLDRFALHPFWGPLILLAVFALLFALSFLIAAPLQDWLDTDLLRPLATWITASLAGTPPWLSGLLAEGVLGGAGILVTFLPLLTILLAALALLQDSGYLARAAYLMDRYLHPLGLHGKSFLPLCLGFGCNVPAILGARVIESPSARLLTILLAPLVPCSARLLMLSFLTPIFFGHWALAVAIAVVALNLVLLALLGILLNQTLFRQERDFFIMEMPLYQFPQPRGIGLALWRDLMAFLRKAGSLILLFAVCLWTLDHFPGPGLEDSYLARFGQLLAPLGDWLGLDWRLLLALLASFPAKENALATLSILYGSPEGAGLAATLATQVPPASALSFIVATLLFIPCMATVAVTRQETGHWGWTLLGPGLMLVMAWGMAGLVYQTCRLLGWGLS